MSFTFLKDDRAEVHNINGPVGVTCRDPKLLLSSVRARVRHVDLDERTATLVLHLHDEESAEALAGALGAEVLCDVAIIRQGGR